MKKAISNIITHALMLILGFALGVYLLPILTAPKSPDINVLQQMAKDAVYTASFSRDLKGSDFLHWGEGSVSITPSQIVHEGRLSPGPDYKLYLVSEFVEDEKAFLAIKASAQYVGDVKSFNGFVLDIPEGVNVEDYSAVIVWCEAFSEFITAAKYQ